MDLGETQQYKAALEALHALQVKLGNIPEVRSIAVFLLYANTAQSADRMFPFVGIDDPRDRAVVAAYEQAFTNFVNGEGDDDWN